MMKEDFKNSIEAFTKLVHSRRSVRIYEDVKVPDEVIRKSLSLSLLAPNSSNLQCWEFYWIKDPKIRKKIDEAFLSQPAATTASDIVIAVARPENWKKHSKQMIEHFKNNNSLNSKVETYYKKITPFVYTIGYFSVLGFLKSILLWFLGWFRPVPRESTSQSELNTWAVKSTALACENFMLSIQAHGYDTCPMEGFDSKRVKKILKLPRKAVLVMGISLGQGSEKGIYGDRIRFPEDQFLFEV